MRNILGYAVATPLFFAATQKPELADVCPWCHNDPAMMQAAGVVPHGPIAICPKGSATLASSLAPSSATGRWIFLLAFRRFHAAAVADVKRFPMSRAFRCEPLARGPEAKTVEVMVSARSHASVCAKGRAHDRGCTRNAPTSVQVIKAMQRVA